MDKIAILLVTYIDDIKYVERLIPNYLKYNRNKIPLYIVTPASDKKAFEKFTGDNIHLFTADSITDNLVNDNSVRGIRPGYVNQEILSLLSGEKKYVKIIFAWIQKDNLLGISMYLILCMMTILRTQSL
ncbi:MAG TPA: hypothetical protein DCG34_02230 [Clostridiales bacterium]|nr:hypothetical protein [Clostridiales bacterium]